MVKPAKRRVVIFGVGQVAEVAWSYVSQQSDDAVVEACTVDSEFLPEDRQFHGLEVVPFEDIVKRYDPREFELFLPLSYRGLNGIRRTKYEEAKRLGYRCYSYVHPSVHLWNRKQVGENCMILENNVIQPFSAIGDNVIVWSHCHIGHHSRINSHVYVTSGTVVCGSTVVGEQTFVGAGVLIRDGIRVGARNLLGMGAILTEDTPDDTMYIAGLNNVRKTRVPLSSIRI